MNSRLGSATVGCAAFGLLLALGCDRNVVVGYTSVTRDTATHADAGVAQDASTFARPEITWISGAHAGNDLQDYVDFGAWRNRPLDMAQVFPDRTGGWDGVVTPGWPVDMFAPFAGLLVMSEPLYPEGQGNNQDCAAGMYDIEWQKLGKFLVDSGRPDTIVRLGWGFNDASHAWRAEADPADWLACFRRVVSAIRSTDDAIQIDWSFNPPGAPDISPGDPFAAYPGDDYVDYIGIEAFDTYPPTYDDAAWDTKCNGESGLCRVMQFAREHNKKVGIAEWGGMSCGADPGGDNPFFVQKMVETFAANTDVLAYEAYFEDSGPEVCSTISGGGMNPNAAARYRELYRAR